MEENDTSIGHFVNVWYRRRDKKFCAEDISERVRIEQMSSAKGMLEKRFAGACGRSRISDDLFAVNKWELRVFVGRLRHERCKRLIGV